MNRSRSPLGSAVPSAAALVSLGASLLAGTALTACGRRPAGSAARGQGAATVTVVRPERRTLTRTLNVPGTVQALQEVTLYAKTAGYLSRITVDRGDRVKGGQIVARISVPEMERERDVAAAQLRQAEATFEVQQITAGRLAAVRQAEPGAVTQQQVDESQGQFLAAQANIARLHADLERLDALMRYTTIRAPFDAIVTERFVDPGALIQLATTTAQAPIVTVMDMDTVRVFAAAPERDVPFVTQRTPARLAVDALPGVEFVGTVTRFSTALDPKTRTMKTEIDFPNRDHRLRPGMFGAVSLELEKRPDALTLPAGALLVEKDAPYVFVVADGKAKRVPITTGFSDAIQVEVLQGLSGTESVILAGKGLVVEGRSVHVGAQE